MAPMSNTPLFYLDADALARAAAVKLLSLAGAAIAERGVFTLALSGGSTPKKLYALLAKDPAFAAFPWAQTQLFFGDERHVPPDDPESNFRMVKETLLASGHVPEANVHRVPAELIDAAQAAAQYEAELRRVFAGPALLDGFPRFDVILLGMGPDGHTASLFPDSPALDETFRNVIPAVGPKPPPQRITMTFPLINAARKVCFLVKSPEKLPLVERIVAGDPSFPASRVRAKSVTWLVG